jgi:hypothetical protein
VLVAAGALAAIAEARGIRSATERPVAVRGGVMLLPLAPKRPRAGWPATAEVRFENGRAMVGAVAWVDRAVPTGPPRWTDDPRHLSIRPIRSDDAAPGRPYLLVRVPEAATGALDFGGQRLEPTWFDRPAPGPTAPGPSPARIDRPDPSSPFEHWRGVLLAERLGEPSPAPPWPADDVRTLFAEHQADLWRIALARLQAIDLPAAVACRSRLTQLAADRGRKFAAWVADPTQTAALLAMLLDVGSSREMMAAAARQWLAERDPLLIWIESPGGDRTRLAVVNRTEQTLIGRFTWPGREEIPIAVEFRPEALQEVLIDRPIAVGSPDRSADDGPDRRPWPLEIDVEGRTYEVTVGAPYDVARPPGAFVRTLRPPLSLAEVEMRAVQPVDEARACFVNVRRRFGRWEVFFECRRTGGDDVVGAAGADAPAPALRQQDRVVPIPGEDSVQLLLGPATDADGVQLIVPELGGFQVRRGRDDGSLQVFRRSYEDRWYCRIVLPAAWLPTDGSPLVIGCARTIGRDQSVQIAPGFTTPWRRRMGHSAISLDQWDSLPQPPTP